MEKNPSLDGDWRGIFVHLRKKKKGSEISVTLVKYRQTRPLLIVIIQFVLKKINSSPSVQAEHAVLVLY